MFYRRALQTQPQDLESETIQNNLRTDTGLQIVLFWSSNVSDANKNFVRQGAQILVDLFTTPAINRLVISNMDSGLGESNTALVGFNSYEDFKNTYPSTKNTFTQSIFANNMPSVNPLELGDVFFVTSTQYQAWTSDPDPNSPISSISLNFSLSNTFDMIGVVLHEMTETMGRLGGFSQNSVSYRSVLDLSSYTHHDVRATLYEPEAYFSIDAGASLVSIFNSNTDGDPMDWSGETVARDCCNAFAAAGVEESLSIQDLVAMLGIGYDLADISYPTSSFPVGQNMQIENNFSRVLEISSFQSSLSLPRDLQLNLVTGIVSGVPRTIGRFTTEMSLSSAFISATGDLEFNIVTSTSSGLSPGVIAAITVSVVVFVVLLSVMTYFLVKGKK
jgi:hypothetical protein